MTVTRRQILIGLTGLAVVKPFELVTPSIALATKGLVPPSPLTPEEQTTLAAAVDRILPGAADAGVPDYIGFWLSQAAFQGLKRYISAGLGFLDKTAGKSTGGRFVDTPLKEQDNILTAFARGEVTLGKFDGRLFFQKLMELTLEGFLSDPRYGGNRDRVGWRFIGIPDGLGSCWWNPDGVGTVLDPESGFRD